MNKDRLVFEGIVKDVRIYRGEVYLFVKCQRPIKNATVRFELNKYNSVGASFHLAAKAEIGSTAYIVRSCKEGKYAYYVDFMNDALPADIVLNSWATLG